MGRSAKPVIFPSFCVFFHLRVFSNILRIVRKPNLIQDYLLISESLLIIQIIAKKLRQYWGAIRYGTPLSIMCWFEIFFSNPLYKYLCYLIRFFQQDRNTWYHNSCASPHPFHLPVDSFLFGVNLYILIICHLIIFIMHKWKILRSSVVVLLMPTPSICAEPTEPSWSFILMLRNHGSPI